MQKKKWFLILLSVLLFIGLYLVFKPVSYRIYTEEFIPYNYSEGGKVTGLCSEIVKAAMDKMGVSYPIIMDSWTTGYLKTVQGPKCMLYSTVRTETREKLFKWAGPLSSFKYYIYARKGTPMVKDLEDIKGKAVATVEEDYAHQFLLSKGFGNLVSIKSQKEGCEKLIDKTVDYWASTKYESSLYLKELGLPLDAIEPIYLFSAPELYLAFSRDTPNKIVAAWQQALDELRSDGFYAKMHEKYHPDN